MTATAAPLRGPSNGALAEALFTLAEREPAGDRRLALLRAGYAAMDSVRPARRGVLDDAPPWLKPLVSQLAGCRGEGALAAAVERLSTGQPPHRRATRQRFFSRSEVERVLATAPEDLQPQRLRGAFHWHTDASDGRAALETMARTCARRGASWAVVSDHSRGLEVASGLDHEGVRLQRRRVERWNRRRGDELHLLQGLEAEILLDGTVDVPAAERREVDCLLVALHKGLGSGPDQTERLLRAVATPGVHVLAHPRGRLFHHRQGVRARWELVFAACRDNGVAVEINGFPRRQDLDWELARLAADAGCDLILASDAHAPSHLELDAYACAIAARAEVPAERILNRLQPDAFADWLDLHSS
ncbi:MAG: hypothetical protein LJE95_02360 [Acidobacteria bacterium]|nr:hypothetical protein [Acidobacteriota bacterium]